MHAETLLFIESALCRKYDLAWTVAHDRDSSKKDREVATRRMKKIERIWARIERARARKAAVA